MPSFCRTPAVVLATLLALAPPSARAQSGQPRADGVDATRVRLEALLGLAPGPEHGGSASVSMARIVSDHWQLGVSSTLGGYTSSDRTAVGSTVETVANVMTAAARLRGYAGAYLGASNGSYQIGVTRYGAQIGRSGFSRPRRRCVPSSDRACRAPRVTPCARRRC